MPFRNSVLDDKDVQAGVKMPKEWLDCVIACSKISKLGLPVVVPVTEFRDIIGAALTATLSARIRRPNSKGDRPVPADSGKVGKSGALARPIARRSDDAAERRRAPYWAVSGAGRRRGGRRHRHTLGLHALDERARMEAGRRDKFRRRLELCPPSHRSALHRCAVGTLLYSAGGLVLPLVLGTLAALVFHEEFPLRGFLRGVFVMPMMATPVAIAVVWTMIFQPQLGVANCLLSLAGIRRNSGSSRRRPSFPRSSWSRPGNGRRSSC